MKDKLDAIAELPLPHRIGIACVLLAAINGAFWQLLYSDLAVKKSELEEEVNDTKSKIQSEKKIVRNLDKYEREVKELDEQLANVLRELPDKKEIEGFLRSISVLAIDTGLEVLSFTPRGEDKDEYFASLPVHMSLEGSFHQLVTFFDEIAHLPRIVNINDISINILSETAEEVIIQASCTATTFRYLEEGERNQAQDQGARRRRK